LHVGPEPFISWAYEWYGADRILVFSLRAVVMYTAVEGIQFSPHWVDGSRSSAGHCCLWLWGAKQKQGKDE
jgi:hypothetical protein